MNELQTRLAKLRRHARIAPNLMTSVTGELQVVKEPATAVGQRLRELGVVRDSAIQSQKTVVPHELAKQLGGQLVGEGLIVVEQCLPLGTLHGRHCIDNGAIEAALRFFGFGESSAVFMDTETTGLAGGTGTLVFLLGLGRLTPDGLQLSQYFLTGFKGESMLLEQSQEFLNGAQTLITYNGKSFDHPLLKARYRLAGMADPFAALAHLDLLYPTRRAYAHRWPNCRLRTTEENLIGFNRVSDLPGSEAPETWFNWVRRGVTDNLPRVLRHNALDIISLVVLLPAIHRSFNEPLANKGNILASARHYLGEGDEQKAYELLLSHRACLEDQALLELARLNRRNGDLALSVEIWHELLEKGTTQAAEHLAKYYEHVAHDYRQALQFCRKLIQLEGSAEQHRHRERRLLTKFDNSRAHIYQR